MDIISSRTNGAVKLLRQLLRDKRARDGSGCFAAEGDHLCGELARSDCGTELFAYTERAADKYPGTVRALLEKSRASVVITEDIAEYISDTKTPQGLFAAAKKRAVSVPEDARRIIIADGVQDPGNVGTILRAAEALGLDGAVLLEGCADIYSPKTLRASMGSVLRLPCITGGDGGNIKKLSERGFTVYGAMLDSGAGRLGELVFPERTAVVIGSEGAGISPGIAALCAEKIYIPISGAESLNAAAAAAVIMWEMRRS